MAFNRYLLATLIAASLLMGCQDKERAHELDAREQSLLAREKEFAIKEADYQSLLRMRDSLLTRRDTAVVLQRWPDDIAGLWASKSVCRESNCSEYVIGDLRSNTWEFVSDSTGLYTRVINNNKVVRVFSAKYDSTSIQLHYTSDSSAARNMELNVELTRDNKNLIKGMQTTGIDKSCTAKFSIELNRLTNR
ncbi:hypothetical protein J2Y45_002682 [Dyadobacter sp. BE34]|uniref:Lipoprotein n=1 Tax=Dyadobacter fermentans TaxID=94254 RepID=A0ABU1QWB1_9BACT|nr:MULTISPECIES: hypothetical protein [Dyadobacter]MDR6805010.1 hypothetical protein [Dyadobacter fermentans]MDR7043231.1 hypothetical protein [Dyadobacter sp. BE242]MDR7197543.1 hypothetical protein [Dyadobacter sp. BE34]MDR7215024.1 hypothetical protein [Dyadobacter sp. BE31]MDR7262559.1 hypothetical protein [Dyadobacter sp. BE32]